jgi:outer membrane protein assembly factor BamE
MQKSIVLLAFCLLIQGCSALDWLVYQPDIEQGNYITKEQINKLKIGMSRKQVRYIFGQPMIQDSFDNSRWYYTYFVWSGKTNEITQKNLTIHFTENQVDTVESDYDFKPEFNTPEQPPL